MTTAILTTTPAAIAGFLSIVPKSDIRYYLNGVYVEPDTGIMIATDAHVLLANRTTARVPDVIPPFIIPRALLENVAKAKCAQVRISIDTSVSSCRVITLQTGNGEGPGTPFEPDGRTFSAQECDGRFPDWRRTVPRAVSGAPAQLDPHKVLQAHDAMGLVCGWPKKALGKTHISYDGAFNAAVVTCPDIHTFAIVMPWRGPGSDLELTLKHFDLAPSAEVAPADVAQAA